MGLWTKKTVPNEVPMIEIQLIGIENLNRRDRPARAGIKVYGRRVADLANRMVSVELNMVDAEELIEYMSQHQDMPIIEVPIRSWSYVATVGQDEAKFREVPGDLTP